MRVEDVMTPGVLTTDPEATLREVAEVLADAHVSGLPVMASGRLVGVVSATDILTFSAESPGSPTARPTAASLEPDSGAVPPDVDEETPVSFFLDFWDDAGMDVTRRFGGPTDPEWNVLDEHTVDEVMTRALYTTSPGTGLREAAAAMLEHGVHRLLVMENGTLVGMLSTTDLMRALAERGLAA